MSIAPARSGLCALAILLAALPGVSSAATNQAPTIVTPVTAAANPVTGTSVVVHLRAADDTGEAGLLYAWSVDQFGVRFSDNVSNRAKDVVVNFPRLGTYRLTCLVVDRGQLSVSSSLVVEVVDTVSRIAVAPQRITVPVDGQATFTPTFLNQYGAQRFPPGGAFPIWSVDGGGTIEALGVQGVFTATRIGDFKVTATLGGAGGSAAVTVVPPGEPGSPFFIRPPAAALTPVTGTQVALSALATDDLGEAGLTYTWTSPSASFAPNGTNPAKETVATFSQSDSVPITLTVRDRSGLSVTRTIAVVVQPTPQSLFFDQYPSVLDVGSGQTATFNVSGIDQFGRQFGVPSATVTWSVSGGGSIAADGTFTAGVVPGGPFTVTARVGAAVATTGVRILAPNQAPVVVRPAAADPNPVTGTQTVLSVVADDDAGEAALRYFWVPVDAAEFEVPLSENGQNSSKRVTATFTRAGSFTMRVIIVDQGSFPQVLFTTSEVIVTVSPVSTRIAVTPADQIIAANRSLQFNAVALDQFDHPLAIQPPFTWSVSGGGRIDATGLFRAGNANATVTVTASGGGRTGSTQAFVGRSPPTIAQPAAADPTVVTGTTSGLSVLGADGDGESTLTYTWSDDFGVVQFAPNGSSAAKRTTATFAQTSTFFPDGKFPITVVVRNRGGLTATSRISVRVEARQTAIFVQPAAVRVAFGNSASISATVLDQFSQPFFPPTDVTDWNANGGGSLTVSGSSATFLAGSTAGRFQVVARLGALSTTVPVEVADFGPRIVRAPTARLEPGSDAVVLDVLADDADDGEPALFYHWEQLEGPSGVGLLDNFTNSAKHQRAGLFVGGHYVLRVRVFDPHGSEASALLAFDVPTVLAAVVPSPPHVELEPRAQQRFAVSLFDQFGQPFTGAGPVQWTVSGGGRIDATGLFTAGGTPGGPFQVRASTGGVVGEAAVIVLGAAPTIARVAAASPAVIVGTSTQLSVLGADDGGEAGLIYSWTVAPGFAGVTFSANDANAAKLTVASFQMPGPYAITVSVRDRQGRTATSSVQVTVENALRLDIIPAATAVPAGGEQLFEARQVDQFGRVIFPDASPVLAWSVGGGGTIEDGSRRADPQFEPERFVLEKMRGYFTASDTAGGPFTVTANGGGFTGSARFFVTQFPVVRVRASSTTLIEGGPAATITVSRTGPSTSALRVPLIAFGQADPASDVSPIPTEVTIPAGRSSLAFTLRARDDGVSEGPESLIIAPVVSPDYNIAVDGGVVLGINDPLPPPLGIN